MSNITDIEDCGLGLSFDPQEMSSIREGLLEWYDQHQRSLPWRKSSKADEGENSSNSSTVVPGSPYAVWVSEIMLQQTRVATVVDYFNRWMERWPTVLDLARATPEEVNEAWAGLGYYRRAALLHQGAKEVVEKHGGSLPRDAKGLLAIPGIGAYTAGAIASIAFQRREALVDGNVIRVLARLRGYAGDTKAKRGSDAIWEAARQLVPEARPGDFNQALMELGATCCTPKAPGCCACPVRATCAVSKKAEQLQVPCEEHALRFPSRVEKKASKQQSVAVCAVHCDSGRKGRRWLMVKRPPKGLLANLWEFPTVEVSHEDSLERRREAMLEYLAGKLGLAAVRKGEGLEKAQSLGTPLKHIFSHIDQTLHVEVLQVSQEKSSGKPETRWLDDEQVAAAAVPTQMKKVFKAAVAMLSGDDNASHGGKNKKRKRTDSADRRPVKMAPIMERFLFKRQKTGS